MKGDGFVDEAWQNHLKKIATVDCLDPANAAGMMSDDTDSYSLGLQEMGGIFIMHAALSGLALAVALFQYFRTKWRKPHKNLRPLRLPSSSRLLKSASSLSDNNHGSSRQISMASQACKSNRTLINDPALFTDPTDRAEDTERPDATDDDAIDDLMLAPEVSA